MQVTHPLRERNMIMARLDAVSEIAESMGSSQASKDIRGLDEEDIRIVTPKLSHMLSSLLTTLGRSPDIQRGITRIFHRTATPSEVSHVICLALLIFTNLCTLRHQCPRLYLSLLPSATAPTLN